MIAPLDIRPHDAAFTPMHFLKKPLHWGMWTAINDLIWLYPPHRIPLARLQVLLCSNNAHRRVLAEVIDAHFDTDAEGFVTVTMGHRP